MRYLPGFFSVITTTHALNASIFTFGHNNQPGSINLVDSDDAFQPLIELRARSSSSALGGADDNTIELLSRFAGASCPLFGVTSDQESMDNIIIIMDGINDVISSSIRNWYQGQLLTASFPITSAIPDILDGVIYSFSEDSRKSKKSRCAFQTSNYADFKESTRRCLPDEVGLQTLPQVLSGNLLQHISMCESLLDWERSTIILRLSLHPRVESGSSTPSDDLLRFLFDYLHSLSTKGKQVTGVLLPDSKQLLNQPHGLRKRKESFAKPSIEYNLKQRAIAPLSLMPMCHASNSSCNEATNTCSGHGYCYRKSSSDNQGSTGDCYACQCFDTVIKKDDGTEQKVRWGGSACQKRDISSPFFLIVGVTLAVTAAIAMAIVMIFQVGNCELPGVISAGVGSPRTQK